jgi:membrane protein DedA with SNARE-associated domain
MIENTVNWMIGLMESMGYLGIVFAVFLETVFPPIPSAFILPFAGFVSARTEQSLIISILAASFGSYLGTLPFYFLGVWGEDFVNRFLRKYGKYMFIEEEEVDKAFEFFDKHGKGIVLTGRFIPMVRSVISFPAGVARMPFVQFTIYTLLGGIVWSTVLATSGYFLGEQWENILIWLSLYENIAMILVVLVVLGYIAYKIIGRSRRKKGI